VNNYDFYKVLLNHEVLFGFLTAASLVLHYFVFRRVVITVFDPYFLHVLFSAFSMPSVYLLYFTGHIPDYLAASYTLTQLAFWMGIYAFPQLKSMVSSSLATTDTSDNTRPGNYYYKQVFFYASAAVLIVVQLAIYKLKGVPLLMASRLTLMGSGGGVGVLGRIADVSMICVLYSFFDGLHFGRHKMMDIGRYFVFGLVLMILLLSGSKSSLTTVVFVLWAYIVFEILKGGSFKTQLNIVKKYYKQILLGCVGMAVLVIAITAKAGADSPLFLLFLRLVHTADVYWYAYPNDVYLRLTEVEWWKALFLDFLGMTRLYTWEELPKAIGVPLKQFHHPSDIPEGPNARHNVFGLVYMGFYWSIAFSFILGVTLSFVRNVLPRMLKKNVVGGVVFTYLVIKISGLDSDPMLALTYVNNAVFIMPFVLIPILLLCSLTIRRNHLISHGGN
jgi:hypothetical protein